MIVAEQKQLDEVKNLIGDAENVLVVGCGTCVTVCFAGGTREAAITATSLRMSSKLDGARAVAAETSATETSATETPAPETSAVETSATETSVAETSAWRQIEVSDVTVQRQCEWEYLDQIEEQVEAADVVLSLGCGIGVQAMAEHFPNAWIVPGLNTTMLGMPTEQGVWAERCAACGDCILGLTGGICPIARCAKSLLNGPCGGSENGHCEIDPGTDCAWQLIYDRLGSKGKLDVLLEIQPPKNWQASRDGGPRKIVRQDLRLISEEETD